MLSLATCCEQVGILFISRCFIMESMKHGPASWKGPIKGIKRAERERERERYRILIHGGGIGLAFITALVGKNIFINIEGCLISE